MDGELPRRQQLLDRLWHRHPCVRVDRGNRELVDQRGSKKILNKQGKVIRTLARGESLNMPKVNNIVLSIENSRSDQTAKIHR